LSFAITALLVAFAGACTDEPVDEGEDLDGDGKADGTQPGVSADNLDGLWDARSARRPCRT
jgi:hypothetical protein